MLSFGTTKGGTMAAEAVVFFPPQIKPGNPAAAAMAAARHAAQLGEFARRQKRAGHVRCATLELAARQWRHCVLTWSALN